MAAIGRFFASIGKEILVAIGTWFAAWAAEKGVEKAGDVMSKKKKKRWWRR